MDTLELKIYRFSINVFSFVKSLDKVNISNSQTQTMAELSNSLYSKFTDYEDAENQELKSKYLEECVKISLQCFELFKKVDFKDALLNEKVDLTIEASEISKTLVEKFGKQK
ncbi:MAG: hypothetical protein JXR51_16030 [Bacteroidales bacterium]|nr:hypothetical protein [Bacteroidales bacterium]MBN2758676.1 hypothetical protein [Bacteroidales bacterium]